METQSANFENDFIKVTSSGYTWTIQFKKDAVAYQCTAFGYVPGDTVPVNYSAGQSISPNAARGYVIVW